MGPSKVIAAEFLRHIARDAGLPVADREQRAADLRLVADCIEGKAKWARGGEHSFYWRQQINMAADMVDHRNPGEPVGVALDRWASALAKRMGRAGPDEEQKLRDHIAASRKRQAKARREK